MKDASASFDSEAVVHPKDVRPLQKDPERAVIPSRLAVRVSGVNRSTYGNRTRSRPTRTGKYADCWTLTGVVSSAANLATNMAIGTNKAGLRIDRDLLVNHKLVVLVMEQLSLYVLP